MEDKYASQKRHLASKKQLRVWMDAKKYDRLKEAVSAENESIYGLINKFVDNYLADK